MRTSESLPPHALRSCGCRTRGLSFADFGFPTLANYYVAGLQKSGRPSAQTSRMRRCYVADLRWLYAWCWQTVDLPSPDGHWQEWSHFIQAKPGRYKGLCKRAKALAVIQFAVIAALDGLHKALCQIS